MDRKEIIDSINELAIACVDAKEPAAAAILTALSGSMEVRSEHLLMLHIRRFSRVLLKVVGSARASRN